MKTAVNELDLFTSALARTNPAERAAFLDDACAGNPTLRRRMDELLAGHAQADSPLDRLPADLADIATTAEFTPSRISHGFEGSSDTGTFGESVRPPVPADRDIALIAPGTIIAGRYTLSHMIGEGGMGSVYLATQTEPVRRQVALKLIKSGMDSRQVLARFDAERQALALMDHPNIARIYDGGVTPSGQPFFVMELVTGVPLTDYCDANRLTVDARLQLFVAVCQAVQHAHQKGIIHRDLKPGNVLVTEVDGRPTPKVIDFGVAKATELKLTDLSLVDAGAIVGTPTYMSPEQADPTSMDIDTRTDVYALGVMLYELLTGSPPIDSNQFKRGALLEMLRLVREVEPPRPSTKLSTADALANIAANRNIEPAKLTRLLQGELDWVVMKALEKDRTRRYESANGLAQDLQRYLADEIVEARPPSRSYRLRKSYRRNRAVVIVTAVMLLLTGVGAVGLFVAYRRALTAEHEARDQRDEANAARAEAETRRRSAEADRKRALKQTEVARAVEKFLTEDFISQIDMHASLPVIQKPDSEIKLKTAIDRAALKIQKRFVGNPLTEAALRTAIGRAYVSILLYTEARPHLEEGRRLALAETGRANLDEVDIALAREIAQDATFHLGWVEVGQGRIELGTRLIRESGKYSEQVNEVFLKFVILPEEILELGKLAELLEKDHQLQAAADARFTAWLAFVDPNRYADLEVVLRKKIAERRVAGSNNWALADLSIALADICHQQKKFAQADSVLTPIYNEYKQRLGETNSHTVRLGGQLGETLLRLKQFDRAEPLLRQAWTYTQRVQPGTLPVTQIQSSLGAALIGQKKFDEAETLLLGSFERTASLRKDDIAAADLTRTTLDNLIQCCAASGKIEHAVRWRVERAKYTEVAPPPRGRQ